MHTARMRARDDLAEMLCKRMAAIVKKARTELEEIRLQQRETSERLIGTYRRPVVTPGVRPDSLAITNGWRAGRRRPGVTWCHARKAA